MHGGGTDGNAMSDRAGFILAIALAFSGPVSVRALQNGVGDTEVVFGMSAPFSGTAKEYGRQLRLGFEVAFAEMNEAGGIHGRQLRLVAMDDAYEVARARIATRDLIERHKVFAIVSQFGTASSEAVLPYVLDRQVLFFAPYTGAGTFYNDPPDRYVFTYRPSYKEETAAAVRYLVEVRRLKPSQIAVFQQNDNFGDSGFTGVAYQVRKYRLDPAKLVRVTYPRNTVDVDGAVHGFAQDLGKHAGLLGEVPCH
jgi:branched-chain amino acid transport system substrate-binding protein